MTIDVRPQRLRRGLVGALNGGFRRGVQRRVSASSMTTPGICPAQSAMSPLPLPPESRSPAPLLTVSSRRHVGDDVCDRARCTPATARLLSRRRGTACSTDRLVEQMAVLVPMPPSPFNAAS